MRWIRTLDDENGALNDLLVAAPSGAKIGALISLNDFAVRPARGSRDDEEYSIGTRLHVTLQFGGNPARGAVYCATDTKLNREVAIKVLLDMFATTRTGRRGSRAKRRCWPF